MATLRVRSAARDAFLAKLFEAARDRDLRWEQVTGVYGASEPAWVRHEAEQMLELVNEIRADHNLPPATLDRILKIEQSACGHSDYADKYALRCAFLALGKDS